MPDGDWDAQFRDAVADEAVVADAFDTWRAVRARADAVMDGLGPADLEFVWDPDDRIGSVRDALIQVLYEYSRHCGHLDLLREAIDGADRRVASGHSTYMTSRSSQRARSSISAATACLVSSGQGPSSCTASTRSTPSAGSAVASSFPTSRSPCRIGSA